MAVPAHDERDFEFAKTFDLAIVAVVSPDGKHSPELNKAFSAEGVAINSVASRSAERRDEAQLTAFSKSAASADGR